jgi:hypothetical protein
MGIFSSPVFVLGSVVATFWAGVFHLFFGKRWLDLVRQWFVALVAFGVGQLMASALDAPWPMLGQLHIIEASLVCLVAMFIARWIQV